MSLSSIESPPNLGVKLKDCSETGRFVHRAKDNLHTIKEYKKGKIEKPKQKKNDKPNILEGTQYSNLVLDRNAKNLETTSARGVLVYQLWFL